MSVYLTFRPHLIHLNFFRIRMHLYWILLSFFVPIHEKGFAQKFEAEEALITDGASLQINIKASGGAYVDMGGGNIIFNIDLEKAGYYNISIKLAAPHGEKNNKLEVNGSLLLFYTPSSSNFEYFTLVAGLKLSEGSNIIAIRNSWGWIDVDYLELTEVPFHERFQINTDLVTSNPMKESILLYRFLYDHYGKRVLSGAMTGPHENRSMEEVEWIKGNTGKEPVVLGVDFMNSGRNYDWYNDKEPIIDAKNYYLRNGIPVLMWHWRDPSKNTEEFYSSGTSFDVSKIFDTSSSEYASMLSDIDYISKMLKELQKERIPVLWRPLHEAAGGWFWWGAKGSEACKKLYQIMFDRMVKHHKLKNLIWVWTREPQDDAGWYPGDKYVDIVGRDIYIEGDHGSQELEFHSMQATYKGKKMLSISECGSFPDPDRLEKDEVSWLWFMPWYGEFTRTSKHNPLSLWKKTMAHPYVITLDEMPNLRSYKPGPDKTFEKDGTNPVVPTSVHPTTKE